MGRRVAVVARAPVRDALVPQSVQYAWPLGFVAILSGWYVTEVGRQPWIAAGILRTADAASPVRLRRGAVGLVLFVLVYGVVFSTGIYYINRLIEHGPKGAATTPTRACHPAAVGGRGVRRTSPGRRPKAMDAIAFWLPPRLGRAHRRSRSRSTSSSTASTSASASCSRSAGGELPRPDDEFGRAFLGRQRDLARSRRRRTAGSPSRSPTR